MSHHCPRCTLWIADGKTTGESGIYGSHDVLDLCEPCFFAEEDEIEERGTNDLPDTLSAYRRNMNGGQSCR